MRERLLDPVARMSEILFGLIMALTFTGTLDVATAGNEDVRVLLVGTIGCNLAWGLVDGVMFLISALTERGRNLVTVREVRAAASPEQRAADHRRRAATGRGLNHVGRRNGKPAARPRRPAFPAGTAVARRATTG